MTKQLIRFDWAIKRLLRNKSNFVVLEGFLSELLFDTIQIEAILESESNPNYDIDKFNRVDILTKNSKNELIIVEIQNTYEIDFFHRMIFGTSKAITENIKLGEPYQSIKKVISINIVYFDLGQGKDYIYKGKTTFEGLHQKDILQLSNKQKEAFSQQNVADIFPEYYLIKVNQFDDVAKDTLDEWIYFLKNSAVQDSFQAKGLSEAKQVLDMMYLEQSERYGYERYLDALHLKASEALSLKYQKEEEIEKKARKARDFEIAKSLLQTSLSNEEIAKHTGLTVEQIEQLRKKNS